MHWKIRLPKRWYIRAYSMRLLRLCSFAIANVYYTFVASCKAFSLLHAPRIEYTRVDLQAYVNFYVAFGIQ